MADAVRPTPTPADAPRRSRHPMAWIAAAIVALAGAALIAHGAVRGLAEIFGRASPAISAALPPPPVTLEASTPKAPAVSGEAATPVEATTVETAPSISRPPAGPVSEPSASQGATVAEPAPVPAPPASEARPAQVRAAAVSAPTAGPAYSVPAARPVLRPAPAAPHRVVPPRRRAPRGDGIWVDEDGVFVDGRVVLPFRSGVVGRRAGREQPPIYVDEDPTRAGRVGGRRREDSRDDRPSSSRPNDDGPRSSDPRSVNPY